MSTEKINYSETKKFMIGNIDVEKGVIGSIEDKYIGTQVLGRLERVGGGTDINELMDNVAHVIRLNTRHGTKNSFSVDRVGDEVLPKVVVGTYGARSKAHAEVYLYPTENNMVIEVECEDAPKPDFIALKRALNEVVKNAVLLDEGWGQSPY